MTGIMMMTTMRSLPLAALLAVAACAPTYTLVTAMPATVARNTIRVSPATTWNKAPKTPLDVAWEENWTQNGLQLDAVTFIGGLPDGQAIAKQRRKDDKQVPVFRATMTPPDLVSMIESYYRIRAGATVFETTGVAPVTFLGKAGLAFDYAFVGQGPGQAAGPLDRRNRRRQALHDVARRRGAALFWCRPAGL